MNIPKLKISEITMHMKEMKAKAGSRSMSLSVDWDKIFGQEAHIHKTIHHGFDVIEKDLLEFVSGSTYKGGWNLIGMSKFGTYVMPHKVEYEGELSDGMFNGEGMITYPMGHRVEAYYKNDIMEDFKFMFPDGLMFDSPWDYCVSPDRRFFISMQEGLKPACNENLTNEEFAREIPEGCYDTGDGFFNPRTKCVQSADDPNKVLRIPSLSEEKWIVDNCRKAWDEPTGYRPDIYEKWCNGKLYDDTSSQESKDSINIRNTGSNDSNI